MRSRAKLPPAKVAGFETPKGEWQHAPPTKPGRYWFRCPFWTDGEACVMKVEFVRGKLRAKGEAGKWPLVGMSGGSQWWSEPIQEPRA